MVFTSKITGYPPQPFAETPGRSPNGASWVAQGEPYSANPGIASVVRIPSSCLAPLAEVAPSREHGFERLAYSLVRVVRSRAGPRARPRPVASGTMKNEQRTSSQGSRRTAHPGLPKTPRWGYDPAFPREAREGKRLFSTKNQRLALCQKMWAHPYIVEHEHARQNYCFGNDGIDDDRTPSGMHTNNRIA